MSKRPLEHLGEFKYEACKVVAEIGCNHMGSLETAKELMLLAKKAGAHYAKFQKRCPKELLTEDQFETLAKDGGMEAFAMGFIVDPDTWMPKPLLDGYQVSRPRLGRQTSPNPRLLLDRL